jgi:protein-S-isoprenylcysteine O-methyltransferase Ste14
MTDLEWRLIIIVVAGVSCAFCAVHDWRRLFGEMRSRNALEFLRLSLLACVAVQVIGYDPVPMLLSPTTNMIVRFGGVALGLAAGVGVVWPRVATGAMARSASQTFITSGPYKYLRHPLLAAMLAGFAGIELTLASWLVFGVVTVVAAYAVFLARKRDVQLTATHGSAYSSYVAQTWNLIPLVY